jgi:hypothetical protein
MTIGQQEAIKQIAALDEAAEAVRSEVSRYEHNLYRLIEKLESPGPVNAVTCQERPIPQTIQHVLSEIHGRLVEATDQLNGTIKRIEEQVGELKILP